MESQQQQKRDGDLWSDGGLAISEALSFSGLGRSTLYELMDAGKIAWSKIGARRILSRKSLRLLLEEGATSTASRAA